MFTKRKYIGGNNVRINRYVTVIDWEAVAQAIFYGFVILVVLSQCAV
tara:strand:- start:414 stop:554 length:141 start_codon:yes stop_codon:yes gene_type:complete